MIAFLGAIGLVGFIVATIFLIVRLVKKREKKTPLILMSACFTLFVCAAIATPTSDDNPETWVKNHENKNIDQVIQDYQNVEDDKFADQLTAQVANKKTSMYRKNVVATGFADEFYEGYRGFSKGSFYMTTDDGNKVRVSAKRSNEALDLGEKVEVTGKITSPLSKNDEYFLRDASVYIK